MIFCFKYTKLSSVFQEKRAPNVETLELQNFSYSFGSTVSAGNADVLISNTSNSLNLNTDFTIETWYYPTTNAGVLLERGLGDVVNNNASYIILWDRVNNNLNFASASSNSAASGYAVGSLTGPTGSLGSPTLNAWNHIAVTRAGNSYRGFLNGNLNLSITNANTPYGAPSRGLTIGGMFPPSQAFGGIPSNTTSPLSPFHSINPIGWFVGHVFQTYYL